MKSCDYDVPVRFTKKWARGEEEVMRRRYKEEYGKKEE